MPPLPSAGNWRWRHQRTLHLVGVGTLRLVDDAHGDLALSRLPTVLRVDYRRGGEALATAVGRKPLKNLLQEIDLAPWLRARVPLLYAGARLVAVADFWRDPAVAPASGEQRRARLIFASEFE
jgi:tRNA(Ile)-lysidine synthase